MEWYNTLNKPEWTPEPATFRIVWMSLYVLIAASYSWVFWKAFQGKLPRRLILPFMINLIANMAFTPLFFGLQSITLGLVDILVVWGTIFWLVWSIYPFSKIIAWLQLPQLAWVSVAACLQISVLWLNL